MDKNLEYTLTVRSIMYNEEKVTNIKFAPYNFAYPLINQHFDETKL